MHIIKLPITLFIFLFLSVPSFAWEAEVISVVDGDTINVKNTETGEQQCIRLYGVDAPEGKGRSWEPQRYSRQATNFTKELLPRGSRVTVFPVNEDRYSRIVGGVITLPDGYIVQEELLKAGLVWVDTYYCKNCPDWLDMQKETRECKRGLWQDANPIPPWEWRGSKQKRR